MNRKHILAMASVVLLAITLTGCAAAMSATKPTESSSPASVAASRCNLGVSMDREQNVARASYDALPADSYEVKHYGLFVANQECSDAEILAWQELRREAGESDEICRVVIEYTVDNLAHPIGCAVPVLVVNDAPR